MINPIAASTSIEYVRRATMSNRENAAWPILSILQTVASPEPASRQRINP